MRNLLVLALLGVSIYVLGRLPGKFKLVDELAERIALVIVLLVFAVLVFGTMWQKARPGG